MIHHVFKLICSVSFLQRTRLPVQQLEANTHYRIVVTFNSMLGDVPTLAGKGYFKCVGGGVSPGSRSRPTSS